MTSTHSRFVLVMAVAIAWGAAACGGSGTASLTGPSTIGGSAPAGTGATITGHVNGGSASRQTASVLADSAPGGLTVSIAGTQLSVPVGSSGTFTFSNVTPGPIQLVITGAGTRATISLTVGAQDQVDLAITVTGNNARIDSEHHSGGAGDLSERKGVVSALTGTCPTLTFTVGTTKVTTDASTVFKDSPCASVKNGTAVEVNGRPQSDGSLVAARVERDDGNGEDGGDDDD